MAEKKRFYWLKLKDDFFTQKEIKRLRRIAGGDTYTIIYLKLMLLSLKDEGNLFFDKVEEDFIDELALQIDENKDDVQMTVNYLKAKGLLDLIDTETIMLNQIPNLIGSESEGAERVRKHRKMLQSNDRLLQCNTTVTKCNVDIDIERDIDLDIDKDIYKEPQKKKKKSVKSDDIDEIISLFNQFSNGNVELNKTLISFMEMRKKINKPMSKQAVTILFGKLNELAKDEYEMIEILNNSILSSWQGIFPLNNKQQNGRVAELPAHHVEKKKVNRVYEELD